MPQRMADAIMRGAFARFWQQRISTTIQMGNADMLDLWLSRQGHTDDGARDGASYTPADISDLLAEYEEEWAGQ